LYPLWTERYLTAASDSIRMLPETKPIHAKFAQPLGWEILFDSRLKP
jgi:hypothetical protein